MSAGCERRRRQLQSKAADVDTGGQEPDEAGVSGIERLRDDRAIAKNPVQADDRELHVVGRGLDGGDGTVARAGSASGLCPARQVARRAAVRVRAVAPVRARLVGLAVAVIVLAITAFGRRQAEALVVRGLADEIRAKDSSARRALAGLAWRDAEFEQVAAGLQLVGRQPEPVDRWLGLGIRLRRVDASAGLDELPRPAVPAGQGWGGFARELDHRPGGLAQADFTADVVVEAGGFGGGLVGCPVAGAQGLVDGGAQDRNLDADRHAGGLVRRTADGQGVDSGKSIRAP